MLISAIGILTNNYHLNLSSPVGVITNSYLNLSSPVGVITNCYLNLSFNAASLLIISISGSGAGLVGLCTNGF
jgi:hypothetical protein